MRKKNIMAIILTAIVFLSFVVLGVGAVYRVDEVTLETEIISDEAAVEAGSLKEKLQAHYEGESMFSVNGEAAKKIVAEFPYFRLKAFEKSYPNRIVFRVKEDAEAYAVEKENGYYILAEDGVLLGEKASPVNRRDGENNVIVKGIVALPAENEPALEGDDLLPPMLKILSLLSFRLNGIRSNVTEISVSNRGTAAHPENTQFLISFREGVVARIPDPARLTEEKTDALFTKYLSLSDTERLSGRIIVTSDAEALYTTGI